MAAQSLPVAKLTISVKSSGLVHRALGENSNPSSCCFRLLDGHAGDSTSWLGSLDASERLMRGQYTVPPTSAVVPFRNGMKDSFMAQINMTSAYPCLLMYALTSNISAAASVCVMRYARFSLASGI